MLCHLGRPQAYQEFGGLYRAKQALHPLGGGRAVRADDKHVRVQEPLDSLTQAEVLRHTRDTEGRLRISPADNRRELLAGADRHLAADD